MPSPNLIAKQGGDSPTGRQARCTNASSIDSDFISLQEELHRRIAAGLHESTCQHLIAASLNIMQVRKAVGDPRLTERLCDQLDILVNQALGELRSLTYLFHPQSFIENGLKCAIERYADGFAARTSLPVEHAISPAVDRLPYETQQSLMRIVQEALTNVYRHAKATRAVIAIRPKGKQFSLEISDNGQGMSALHGTPLLSGTGLRIMDARLREMGGRLKILSTSRQPGLTLRATFPHDLAIERSRRRKPRRERC